MPPWVKRTVEWTPEARGCLHALAAIDRGDVVVAAIDVVERYAVSGTAQPCDVLFMAHGPWRGWTRIKEPAPRDGWRIIFRDRPKRRLIIVKRFHLRAVVYLDPPTE